MFHYFFRNITSFEKVENVFLFEIIFKTLSQYLCSTGKYKILLFIDVSSNYIDFYRLQTGMRGAYGKPQGLVARVNIGQIIASVRAKDQHKEQVIEALRRAKFKFPGRQKVSSVD